MKHQMTKIERTDRNVARERIVRKANEFRGGKTSLFMRHLNTAVRICRFNKLVGPDTLETAGFNAS